MSSSNSNAAMRPMVSPIEQTFSPGKPGPVCVVDGTGLSIRVERGHLIVVDGIGRHRRERRYHRATHGLSRLVILGASGSLSLDALRYCDRLGIAVTVIDPRQLRPSFVSIPKRTDDARLRRAQAKGPESELGLEITRRLLVAKLDGQAALLQRVFGDDGTADSNTSLRDQLAESSSYD